jgi:hypothetical protein
MVVSIAISSSMFLIACGLLVHIIQELSMVFDVEAAAAAEVEGPATCFLAGFGFFTY